MDNSVETVNENKLKNMGVEVERMMEFIESKKVYKCSYRDCMAYFDRPYRLAQHILAHNNIRPYLCNQSNCDKAYTSKSHLDRHLRAIHMPQDTDVVYSCPRCFKTFANRQNLKRHLNTVHKLEFSCEICNEKFKKKNQLSAHMYQHTGIKAFSCDQCPESFISLYLKKRHMRYHKKYTCHECGVEFNHWSKYQKHLKTDHQKDEFICNECGKSFNKRCHIVRHVKIHAGFIKTFVCPYENCERSYSRKSNLKQHILVKHMDVLHECTICHSRLSTKAKLNYHLQLHYTSGSHKPLNSINKERKERKDNGSFKTSIALKLAGLDKAPLEFETSLATINEVQQEIRSALSSTNENLNATLADLNHEGQSTANIAETPQGSHVTLSSTPTNTVKSECIEVEVDIPYDI